jgi:hypothetical protein
MIYDTQMMSFILSSIFFYTYKVFCKVEKYFLDNWKLTLYVLYLIVLQGFLNIKLYFSTLQATLENDFT